MLCAGPSVGHPRAAPLGRECNGAEDQNREHLSLVPVAQRRDGACTYRICRWRICAIWSGMLPVSPLTETVRLSSFLRLVRAAGKVPTSLLSDNSLRNEHMEWAQRAKPQAYVCQCKSSGPMPQTGRTTIRPLESYHQPPPQNMQSRSTEGAAQPWGWWLEHGLQLHFVPTLRHPPHAALCPAALATSERWSSGDRRKKAQRAFRQGTRAGKRPGQLTDSAVQ